MSIFFVIIHNAKQHSGLQGSVSLLQDETTHRTIFNIYTVKETTKKNDQGTFTKMTTRSKIFNLYHTILTKPRDCFNLFCHIDYYRNLNTHTQLISWVQQKDTRE